MAMHSFDVVSRIDMQEVLNAVGQAIKEINQRYDFKGSKSSIELKQDTNELIIISDDDYKLKSVIDVLESKLVRRKISLKALQYQKAESAAGGTMRQVAKLQQGISQDRAKELIKLIKGMKLKKVQSEIQKDQLRVKAGKIDDLQTIIAALKEKDLDYHIECINFR